MKTTTKKSKIENTKNAQIIKFFTELEKDNNIEICIVDAVRDMQELESFDQVVEAIEDNNGFDIEIIYYANAIKYLQENDPSLHASLEIADQMGYSLGNLSSEILATLLAQETERTKFYDLQSEIEEFIEELNA